MGSRICLCEPNEDHERTSTFRNHSSELTPFKATNSAVFKQSPNSSLYLPWRYLGKGTFGCTVEVLAKAKKEERYVQKVVNTFHLAEDYLFLNQSLFRELNSSVNFIHVRAIKMEGGKMYILMQRFGGGDLYSFMKRNAKEIDEGFVRELTVSVVLVLEKIHAKGVIYRNLRPENILFVNGDGVFEFSELLFAIGGERCTSYYGAATYTAPQVFLDREEGYTAAVDLWMLGVMLYELLMGATPFEGATVAQVRQNVLGFTPERLSFPQGLPLSENIRNLIVRLLDPNPDTRVTLSKLLKHKFFGEETWASKDAAAFLSVQPNCEREEHVCPNRLLYFSFARGRPLTRDASEVLFEDVSGVSEA